MEYDTKNASYGVELVTINKENGNNIDIKSNGHKITNGVSDDTTRKQTSDIFRCAILGTGNYGTALAKQFHISGVKSCIGSRNSSIKTLEGLDLVSNDTAVTQSQIIFLCIPAFAYENVLTPLKTALIGKTVVEISNVEKRNDPSNALKVSDLLPLTHVIKGLNTVSAYTIADDAYGASRDTFICGNSEEKKALVMQVLREIGLNPIDRGQLRSAVALEKIPFRFFSGWGTALLITILTLVPIMLYTYLRHFWYEGDERADKDLPLQIANIVIAWLMLWLLSLTYLPGILGGFIQLCAGTKYIRFPGWLDRWMKCRKQLGLICLLLASMHCCISCLLMGSGDIKHMVKNTYMFLPGKKSPVILYQSLDARNQTSLLFAVLALAVMTIVGITSLPSVNARMSWREWDFIHRGLGFSSLILGLVHVITRMYRTWDTDSEFGWKLWEKHPKGIFPFSSYGMPFLPMIVIFLKLILLLPGLSCYLNKIRKGKIDKKRNITV